MCLVFSYLLFSLVVFDICHYAWAPDFLLLINVFLTLLYYTLNVNYLCIRQQIRNPLKLIQTFSYFLLYNMYSLNVNYLCI